MWLKVHGKLLPTASANHTTRLWNLGFTSWVTQGCKIVNRNLSMTEWDEFAPRGLTNERPARTYAPGRELRRRSTRPVTATLAGSCGHDGERRHSLTPTGQ